MSFLSYAVDTQVYLPVKQNSLGLDSLMTCLADVMDWLSLNFLIFSEKKTEIIVFTNCLSILEWIITFYKIKYLLFSVSY